MPKKLTKKEFIARSRAKHGDKYGYGRVKYEGGGVKVEIYCRECKEYFKTPAAAHIMGRGCKPCGTRRGGVTRRKLTTPQVKWFTHNFNKLTNQGLSLKLNICKDTVINYGKKFNLKKIRSKHSLESCHSEAKKYKFRGDYAKYSRSSYCYAYSKGILDQICKHMRPKELKDRRALIYAAKIKGSRRIYVGSTSQPIEARLKSHHVLVQRLKLNRKKFIVKVLETGLKGHEIFRAEDYWKSYYKTKKYLCLHSEKKDRSTGKIFGIHSPEKCVTSSKTVTSIRELRKNFGDQRYRACLRYFKLRKLNRSLVWGHFTTLQGLQNSRTTWVKPPGDSWKVFERRGQAASFAGLSPTRLSQILSGERYAPKGWLFKKSLNPL